MSIDVGKEIDNIKMALFLLMLKMELSLCYLNHFNDSCIQMGLHLILVISCFTVYVSLIEFMMYAHYSGGLSDPNLMIVFYFRSRP